MGRGDKKTKRGKIFRGSTGITRLKAAAKKRLTAATAAAAQASAATTANTEAQN